MMRRMLIGLAFLVAGLLGLGGFAFLVGAASWDGSVIPALVLWVLAFAIATPAAMRLRTGSRDWKP